jgi:hypothetical protein
MLYTCRHHFLTMAAVVLALFCGSNQAALGATSKKNAPAASSSKQQTPAEIQTLQQAYSLLEAADHDYQGHRAKAMHHIAVACRILGSSEKGDGHGDEAQSQSDGQLQQAQSLLQGVESTIASSNAHAGKQVTEAIQELTTALSIK